MDERASSGGCLCGAVRYRARNLRDVLFCHCEKCRRTHGHVSAYASARREDLELVNDRGLTWYRSETDETPGVHRGFCRVCGSSLFWDPRGQEHVYISAGTLDQPTGLRAVGHIWLSQAGDYYRITDDLPRSEGSSGGRYLAS